MDDRFLYGGLAALVGAAGVGMWLSRLQRVALVGDSLAVGLTAPLTKLAMAAGLTFQAEAHSGTTCLQWSNGTCGGACGSWLVGFAPQVILIELGTNDIGYSPSPPVGPYQTLTARWGAIGTVVWIDPPIMPNDRLAGVRSVIASLGCAVIPAQVGLSFGSDNIHPTNYAPWAASIASQVWG